MRKLKRELNMAEDKINTLTTQLSTNVTLAALHSLLLARSTFKVRVTGQTSGVIFPSPRNEYTGCVRLFSEMPARASEDYPGEPAYQEGETSLDFTEAVGSGSGISWAICKSAPRSRQITTSTSQHSDFTGRMPFLTLSQQRQSTEGTDVNWKL